MSTFSRRRFLGASGAAVAAACVGANRLNAAPRGLPIGLQLYSVRELMPKDFDGTLSKVAAAGYTEIEAAGMYGHTATDFRRGTDQAGLRCVSAHFGMAQLLDQFDQTIAEAHALGVAYIVCPSPVRRNRALQGHLSLDDWRWAAGQLNAIGAKVKAAGLTLGYHNHGPEFGNEGGVVFYDELLRLTDPALVVFEMDCGWVASAGRNPVDYLSKTPERFPLLHVKDMVRGPNGQYHSTVLGRGTVDYAPILRAATGMKHYFVEQEEFDIDIIEAIQLDADYMRKLKV
jgi:sugar phosphate isomerase/epimerase